jgi:hypothetical protein
VVGQIHLAKIYFTDLSDYKIRPVLILRDMENDVICLQLTSQFREDRVKISPKDLIDGKLKKSSLIVVPKNFTLHKSILHKYLATISSEKIKEINSIFCKSIGCI